MIVSFRDDWLRAFLVDDVRSRNFPSDLEGRLVPQDPDDRRRHDGPGFTRAAQQRFQEKLRGKPADFHSIRVNKQWRLIFKWDGSRGEATSVYLDDHSYT